MKSYKFKIRRPNKTIVQKFEQTLDLCRELYNAGLQERRDAWKINQTFISFYDQQKQLPEIKKIRTDLNSVYSRVLEDVLMRLDKTFKSFFNRVKKSEKAGYPRFKNKNCYDSFCYTQSGFRLDGNNLSLSKIGKVKIYLSQNIVGKVKTCIIKREVSGWFVVFTVETEKELLPKTGKSVGIDAGIENFLTLSNGEQIPNFKYFESSQKKLRVAQRSVSRKKIGSNSRKRAVLRLRKIHQKIKNQRNDFAHKISTRLAKDFDVIAIENLNIKRLAKGMLAKQVRDVAWGDFYQKLEYKAENAGRKLIKVNPSGTSQTCICGETVKKTLAVRYHKCLKCGYSNHRDIVSSQVILNRAVGQTVETLTYAVKQSVVSKSLPVTVLV